MAFSNKNQIVIIGAGVSGLQTAISLLTSPSTSHHKVTIIASHLPGDLSPDYASPWAGGDWRSSASLSSEDAEVREWDKKSYDYWMSLLDDDNGRETTESKEKRIGLGKRIIRYFWGKEDGETVGHDGSGLWWSTTVRDFEVLDLERDSEIPEDGGAIFGIEFLSICLNVPQYLRFLLETAKHLGATIVKSSIDMENGLTGIVREAKSIVARLNDEKSISEDTRHILALVNCTGLAAQNFVSKDEAEKLYPIRGQTFLLKGEAKMGRTYMGIPNTPDDEVLYIIPRSGSGTTILGGCKQAGNWDTEVDASLSERFLERVKREGLAEELRTGEGREFEVISAQVGLRPGRKGGPRVELDRDGMVDDTWIVHAYGHAGGGYQNSVGSAEKVVGIVARLG